MEIESYYKTNQEVRITVAECPYCRNLTIPSENTWPCCGNSKQPDEKLNFVTGKLKIERIMPVFKD